MKQRLVTYLNHIFQSNLPQVNGQFYQLINDSMLFSFRSGQFLFIPGQNLMTSGYDLLS